MNDIIRFSFESTEVRTVTDDQGEPWFVAADVAAVLGYRETRDMTRILDDDEAAPHIVRVRSENGVEQDREMTIISESGLYACILKSRRAEAKRFRKWVTSEVLPALRKTGRYALPDAPCISPAQQRQIQNAIAERFPDGKYRPYAWSRFNNHFQLGSYKQLPAAKTEEALAYIAEMPQLSTETERERYVRELLQVGRFLVSFDRVGLMQVSEIPAEAVVATGAQMVRLIGEPGVVDRAELPSLIEAAAKRLRTA